MRFETRHGVIDVPHERLTRFLQRLEGLDGEFLSGREDVITAIETAKDRVVLSEPQKETAYLVLELWAESEGEAALGPDLTNLRDVLAEDLRSADADEQKHHP
jgi:hypothetical protein